MLCERVKKRDPSGAGFTLIEVVISLAVFVIGIVFLFPLFSGGIAMLGDIDAQTTIANLARAKMAEIEAQGFQAAPADISRTACAAPYDDYEYAVAWQPRAYDVAEASNPVLYEVEVTLYWDSGSGEKSERFKTFISRLQPY